MRHATDTHIQQQSLPLRGRGDKPAVSPGLDSHTALLLQTKAFLLSMTYAELLEWRARRKIEYRLDRKTRLEAARERGRHTSDEWRSLVLEFEGRCVRCGCSCEPTKDHIIPIYRGGSDGIENIQPLCKPCNSSKGAECINWVERRRLGGRS